MNEIKVEIYNYENNQWEDFSSFVVFPLKFSTLLDEVLDEAELQLQFVEKSIFEPLTKVKITIINEPEARLSESDFSNMFTYSDYSQNDFKLVSQNATTKKVKIEKEITFLVANDSAIEKPLGSGKYVHTLYLIELTKLLEGFIGDSITFTNTLGNSRATNSQNSFFEVKDGRLSEYNPQTYYKAIYERGYSIALETNVGNFIRECGIPGFLDNQLGGFSGIYITDTKGNNIYKQYFFGEELRQQIGNDTEEVLATVGLLKPIPWKPYTLQLTQLGSFNIFYQNGPEDSGERITASSTFVVVENIRPIKKWTVADVISRTLETVELLRGTDAVPRFLLQGTQYEIDTNGILRRTYAQGSLAEKLDNIFAPEFSFTKMTLREMLQQVGGFIHGEPRISGLKDFELVDNRNNSTKTIQYYEITYDEYGKTQKSYLSRVDVPYLTKTQSININDYCTALDSSADNLINSLNYAQGVTIEPFEKHYKTVRATQSAIRIEEDGNTVIETSRPIFEIGLENQLIVNYEGVDYDISAYIFALQDYNNLSSYEGTFPYAKAYALYYVQGEKDIRGLFFKNTNAYNPIFSKYAISNILSEVTGQTIDLTISDIINKVKFQIRYSPIGKERIRTNKPIVTVGLPRTLAYNQTANSVETNYFGENLKGLVARLGNVEKSVSFIFAYLNEIPKIGLKYDENYYISAVSVEVLPTCFKCTLGLSKYFNRQSEYVSINTEKRMWEISERQTVERESVFTDYVLISENTKEISNEGKTFYNSLGLANDLFNKIERNRLISLAEVNFYTKNKTPITPVLPQRLALPVFANAIGNALTFSFAFEDNYSAGKQVTQNGLTNYSGYVPYTDYYGRAYYLEFSLNAVDNNSNDTPLTYPLADTNYGESVVASKFVLENAVVFQKDNREIPAITYEMQFVSDGSVIIGSGLASNCKLVNANPKELKLYILFQPINAINSKIESSNVSMTVDIENLSITGQELVLPDLAFGNAWAIGTKFETTEIKVVDEDNREITQTIKTGGDILIGQNKPCKGQRITFELKENIYKKF